MHGEANRDICVPDFIMMPDISWQIAGIAGITFSAAFLKGITGTGLGTIIVSFLSLIVGVKQAVVLTALLSLYAGLRMVKSGPVSFKTLYFGLICSSLIVGTVIGAVLLKFTPVRVIELIMGLMLIIVGTMFTFNLNRVMPGRLLESVPLYPSGMDLLMGFLCGLLTGMIGISLPVLLYHYGRYLSKSVLRHLIVLLFIPSAFIQVVTFAVNGLLSQPVFFQSLLLIPFLIGGIAAGNRIFHTLSEQRFRQYLGIFLYLVALKLVFS